jgi:hypothetical protein
MIPQLSHMSIVIDIELPVYLNKICFFVRLFNDFEISFAYLLLSSMFGHHITEIFFFYFELGGHLGWKSGSTATILEGGHPRIISAKLSQNVPKFELYKHNDELFSICYRIFYEL